MFRQLGHVRCVSLIDVFRQSAKSVDMERSLVFSKIYFKKKKFFTKTDGQEEDEEEE